MATEPSRAEPPPGLLTAGREVVARLAAIVRLERELARRELREKRASLGSGLGAGVGALLLFPFVLGFGLAALAAALALAVATWLALLIVFGLVLLLFASLTGVAIARVRRATPLKPEQAVEEARRTGELLRSLRRG